MPVCSSCGIAWLDGEQHMCGSEPVGVALYVPWARRSESDPFAARKVIHLRA